MQKHELENKFEETFDRLSEKLSDFDEQNINTKPTPESWSAAQVARHLIKANSGFPFLVSGAARDEAREPHEKIEEIKNILLNFELKTQAADFIQPEDEIYEREKLIEALAEIKRDIRKTIAQTDLNPIRESAEFPVFGHLSGLETLAFIIYHTERHIRQLEDIHESIRT